MSASNPNHVDVSDTKDINIFINDENILCNLSSSLKALKTKNSKRLGFGNLSINAVNNKFEQLKYIMKNNIDVFIVTEAKLNSSFPIGQFSIDGFAKQFRRDRNKNGGGVIIVVIDDIPSKEIKVNFVLSDVECLFIELNVRKTKWLIVGCYHPSSQNNDYYVLSSSCVDLFIINSRKSFQLKHSFTCGLSNQHNLVVTVLKNTFRKPKSNIRYYGDWGKFDNAVFRTELRETLIRVERHDYKCFE